MGNILIAIGLFLGLGLALYGLSRGGRRVGGCGCGGACSKSCEEPDCSSTEQERPK